MTRDQALKKVLRCLRLAGSPNPHEAAIALRQARKLMSEYGLTEADADAAAYSEARGKTRCRGAMLPGSLVALSNMIADGFRCRVVILRTRWPTSATEVVFVGANCDATVAAYSFDVLRRQLDAARVQHISRVRKRANREARGEEFAFGWVCAVQPLFPAAEQDEAATQALKAAMDARFPALAEAKPREMGKGGRTNENDWDAGWRAGRDAKLRSGVDGERQRRLTNG